MRIAIVLAGLFAGLTLLSGCQTGDKARRLTATPAPTRATGASARTEPMVTPPRAPAATSGAATRAPAAPEPVSVSESTAVIDAGPEPAVYLVPLEDFPGEIVQRLQALFRDQHGIDVGVLPAIAISEEAVDYARHQLIADRLLDAVADARSADHGGRIVIGLTDYDIMMLDKPEWIFVFSLRDTEMNAAAISVARMDPRSFGERPDEDLLFMRAGKMVAKSIGVLYLGLPMSTDPRSVMYDKLYSLDALDRVSDDFSLSP